MRIHQTALFVAVAATLAVTPPSFAESKAEAPLLTRQQAEVDRLAQSLRNDPAIVAAQ